MLSDCGRNCKALRLRNVNLLIRCGLHLWLARPPGHGRGRMVKPAAHERKTTETKVTEEE